MAALFNGIEQVEYIEHDVTLKPLSYVDQPNAGWNLGRISHRKPGNTTYTSDSSAGAGTCSYILDTGIAANHPVRIYFFALFTAALLTGTSFYPGIR